MSYYVAITRREGGNGVPISPDDLQKVIAHDGRWKVLPPSDDDELWRLVRIGKQPEWELDLDEGELVTCSPENNQLLELQTLAAVLGARVVGEDGADLTNAKVGESWVKKALIGAFGLAGAAFLIWLQRRLTGRW